MKEFLCEICEKSYKSKTALKQHYKQNHYSGQKVYKCNICTKEFHVQEKVAFHIRTVHEGKHYKCESCGKSFSQAINLKNHIHTVHEGTKDFVCNKCDKSYTTAYWLKQHLKKHNPEQ